MNSGRVWSILFSHDVLGVGYTGEALKEHWLSESGDEWMVGVWVGGWVGGLVGKCVDGWMDE